MFQVAFVEWGGIHFLHGMVADARAHMSSFADASSAVPGGHVAESTCGRGIVLVHLLHTCQGQHPRISTHIACHGGANISCGRRPCGGLADPPTDRASDAPVQCLLLFCAIGGHAGVSRRLASDQASDAPVPCLLVFRTVGGRGRLGGLECY